MPEYNNLFGLPQPMTYHPLCIGTGNGAGQHRFLLEQGGDNVLFVIGLNPSTADSYTPDPTMRKVMKVCDSGDFDGYVMMNISSERSTEPSMLSSEPDIDMHRRNLEVIRGASQQYRWAPVLLAFGNGISIRPYLASWLRDIRDVLHLHTRWLCIGEPTREGCPRHPLYTRNGEPLNAFDVDAFLGGLSTLQSSSGSEAGDGKTL